MLLSDRHYVCVHKPAKQHADTSFTQVNDPLTGQLYLPSPIYLVGSAKMLAVACRQKCTPLSRAAHCNSPWTIETKQWLSQTIMNRTQAIAHGIPAYEIELAINRTWLL